MEYTGRFLGEELIEWAIRSAETVHKGKVSVIVADRYANMHPGDAETTSLALTYFVPKNRDDADFAKSFIIDGVGYDYWALEWERLEGIADLKETIAVVLAEGEVVWAASEEDRKRFYDLKTRFFEHLADPQYVCRILAQRLEEAMEIYKQMAFEENIGRLRVGARYIGDSLGDAIAAVNGTYIKCGENGTDDPVPLLKTLRRVPEGYIELQKKLHLINNGEELIAACREMIRSVRRFLSLLLPEPQPETVRYPEGWYEELVYTWRRIQYFCDQRDAANAFGWGAYLQQDMGMLGGLLSEEEQNLLLDFDEKNLPVFAQRCEEARVIIYERLKRNGVKLREYDSFEDFVRENGYDEV